MKKILGIGDPCMDFLAFADELPGYDKQVHLREYGWQGGGKVATAMAAVGRLGGQAALIGGVGEDAFGRFCVADLKRHGVDTQGVFVDPGKGTEFCICISEPVHMSRCLIYKRGGARDIAVGDLKEALFAQADLVHLPYMSADEVPHMAGVMREAARLAHAHGARVSVDLDFMPQDDADFQMTDIVAASEAFYRKRFGDSEDYEGACREMLALGVRQIVFTLGPRGSVGMSEDEPFFHAPGYRVPVMDTTGAGDVFHGALLYGLANDWTLKDSAQFANAVAAFKCTRLGGRAGIPDSAVAARFMETGEIDFADIDRRVALYRTNFMGGM